MRLILFTLSTLLFMSTSNAAFYIGVGLENANYNQYKEFGEKQPELRKRVVIIDTGISADQYHQPYMCQDVAVITYSDNYIDTARRNGHGKMTVEVVARYMNPKKYCITVAKFKLINGHFNYLESIKTLGLLTHLENIHIVNVSYTTTGRLSIEGDLFHYLVHIRHAYVNIAAGNAGQDLDKRCDVYPVCYRYRLNSNRVSVVGSEKEIYSNYGKVVNIWREGTHEYKDTIIHGTSFAVAFHTGKMAN